MAEYAFFLKKADQWRKEMALLLGDISICPPLHQLQTLCHSQAELSSLKKLCHDIAYLLVLAEEEATGARVYGLLTIWVDPSQARVTSMEEAVWKTDCLHLQWTQMALCFGAVTWEHLPCTTPQGGACGHPTPHGGMEVTPCWLISQLEVCQLLVTSPQVIYPIGLNGCDEPIITSLPEPLASSIILTTGEPVYLEINILPLPVEDPDQKVAPLGEVSTIIVASPHKSIPH